MSQISLSRDHTLGLDGAKQAIDQVGQDLAGKYGIDHRWKGNVMEVWGSGVIGTLKVTEETVQIDLSLGFLVAFLKESITGRINDELDSRLT